MIYCQPLHYTLDRFIDCIVPISAVGSLSYAHPWFIVTIPSLPLIHCLGFTVIGLL